MSMKYITYEDFESILWTKVNAAPSDWRRGQAVFNVIDEVWGVARDVQFIDGVDCFYNDSLINEFIACAWKRIEERYNN